MWLQRRVEQQTQHQMRRLRSAETRFFTERQECEEVNPQGERRPTSQRGVVSAPERRDGGAVVFEDECAPCGPAARTRRPALSARDGNERQRRQAEVAERRHADALSPATDVPQSPDGAAGSSGGDDFGTLRKRLQAFGLGTTVVEW